MNEVADAIASIQSNPLSGEHYTPPVIAPEGPSASQSNAVREAIRSIDANPLGGKSSATYLRQQIEKERTWKDVAPELQEQYGIDPETVRQHYQLEEARAVQKGEGISDKSTMIGRTLDIFGREYAPFSGITRQVLETRYAEAMDRFKEGKATEQDAGTIARYERIKGVKSELGSTLQGKAVQALGGAGEMLGEAAALGPVAGKVPGGYLARQAAITPLMPSLYQRQVVENNLEAGRDPNDARGLPTALGMAFVQNLVLGKLPQVGANRGFIGRATAAGGIGEAASQGINVAGGALDDAVLNKGYKTNTRYGTFGNLARGEYGEAAQHTALGFLTFSAFAALHESPDPMPAFKKAIDAAPHPGTGWEPFMENQRRITRAMAENPDLTREQARTLFQDDPPGPVLDAALAMADSLPKSKDKSGTPVDTRGQSSKSATLGKPSDDVHPSGESIIRYPILKNGKSAGEVDIIERNDGKTLHIDWLGEHGKAAGEKGTFLGSQMQNIFRQIIEQHPNAEFLTGLPAGGKRPNERRVIAIPGRGKDAEIKRFSAEASLPDPVDVLGEDAIRRHAKLWGSNVRANTPIDKVLDSIKRQGRGSNKSFADKMQAAVEARQAAEQSQKPPESPPAAQEPPASQSPAEAEIAPPAAPQAVVSAKQTLLDRIRAAEAARGAVPAPLLGTMGPKKVVPEPVDRAAQLFAILKKANEGAGKLAVSQAEMVSLEHAIHGKSLEEIGRLEGVTKQAIDKRLRKVAEKLGLEHPELRAHLDAIISRYAVEEISAGRREDFGDNLDPDAARDAGGRFIRERETLIAERSALADEWIQLQESVKRGERGPVSDAEREQFAARGADLAQKALAAQHGRSGKDQAGEVRSEPAPEAKPAEAGKPASAEAPKPKLTAKEKRLQSHLEGGTEFQKAEAEARLGGTKTMAQEVIERGGINPNSFSDAKKQMLAEHFGVKRWQDVPIFRNAQGLIGGRRHQQHIDTLADELQEAGLIPRDASKHAPEQLMEMILNNSPVVVGEAHMESRIAAEDQRRQQEETARREALSPEERAAEDQAKADAEEAKAGAGHDDLLDPLGNDDWNFGGIEKSAADLVAAKIAERTGNPGITAMKKIETPAEKEYVKESASRWVNTLRDFFRKLGGAKLAATRRLSEAAADAGARVDRSRLYGETQAEVANNDIFKNDNRTITRMIAGAVYVESQLRHTREVYLTEARDESNAALRARAAGDHAKSAEHFKAADAAGAKARAVGTVIGAKDPDQSLSSPLQSEADFRHWSNDAEVKALLARTDELVTPRTEALYREAQGMSRFADIVSKTMLDQPGIPKLSLVALREGQLTPEEKVQGVIAPEEGPMEPGSGNLRRHQLKKLGASQGRTGSATHGYELDLAEIIHHNLVDRQVNADRASYFRTMQKEKVGEWATPGEKPEIATEGWKRLEGIKPPAGTQAAKKGQTDFWLHPDAYSDARQLLATKDPVVKLPVLAAATWANLRSSVDFVSHTKNLLTQWTRGANLRDIFGSLKSQVLGDPGIAKEINELARLSALSDKHLDIGGGLGRFDPARYAGKVLGLMDRSVRVASLRAYDRLVERKLAPDTDAGRRDFINQIGNYSKLTQNRLVAWLRDTGIGPFSTAATTFWMHGLRTTLLRNGVRATSWKAQLQMQAEMAARVAVLPVLAAVGNYAIWGRADGDDKTPWGALKVAEGGGKTTYTDLSGLSGLSRGTREIGLKSALESMRPGAKREGATVGSGVDLAVRDIGSGLIHPVAGPGVDVIKTLFTGSDVSGYQKAHKLTGAEKQQGESQAQYDALAAIWEMNSLAEAWLKPVVEGDVLGMQHTKGENKREKTPGEKIGRMLGPFGTTTSNKAPGAPIGSR